MKASVTAGGGGGGFTRLCRKTESLSVNNIFELQSLSLPKEAHARKWTCFLSTLKNLSLQCFLWQAYSHFLEHYLYLNKIL